MSVSRGDHDPHGHAHDHDHDHDHAHDRGPRPRPSRSRAWPSRPRPRSAMPSPPPRPERRRLALAGRHGLNLAFVYRRGRRGADRPVDGAAGRCGAQSFRRDGPGHGRRGGLVGEAPGRSPQDLRLGQADRAGGARQCGGRGIGPRGEPVVLLPASASKASGSSYVAQCEGDRRRSQAISAPQSFPTSWSGEPSGSPARVSAKEPSASEPDSSPRGRAGDSNSAPGGAGGPHGARRTPRRRTRFGARPFAAPVRKGLRAPARAPCPGGAGRAIGISRRITS